MVKNTLEIGEQRVQESLVLINRFGWLSSVELGKFFWRKSTKAIRNVSLSQLIKKLEEKNLVALRQLPGKNGKALVLLTAGVRLLNNLNMTASSGKDIGNLDDFGNWIPPRNWAHDLLSQRYLLAHAVCGKEFMTERELRQSLIETNSLFSNSTRYPDGLLFLNDQVFALETENASKTGYKRNAMIDNIVKTYHGKAPSFNGHNPDYVVVLANENSRIDHKKNIINALKNIINDDVEFIFALNSKNEFKIERVLVENDEIKRILHKLRHLQIGEEGDCEMDIDHKRVQFKINLSKFKKIYHWSVLIEGKLLENDSSAEAFLKVKEDIAIAILNNSRT